MAWLPTKLKHNHRPTEAVNPYSLGAYTYNFQGGSHRSPKQNRIYVRMDALVWEMKWTSYNEFVRGRWWKSKDACEARVGRREKIPIIRSGKQATEFMRVQSLLTQGRIYGGGFSITHHLQNRRGPYTTYARFF
jgi:hypothetical protein